MKLLFICTHNRCRSILAEAITRQSVTIEANANDEGHLYGSVGAAEIVGLTLQQAEESAEPAEGWTPSRHGCFESGSYDAGSWLRHHYVPPLCGGCWTEPLPEQSEHERQARHRGPGCGQSRWR